MIIYFRGYKIQFMKIFIHEQQKEETIRETELRVYFPPVGCVGVNFLGFKKKLKYYISSEFLLHFFYSRLKSIQKNRFNIMEDCSGHQLMNIIWLVVSVKTII